MCTRKFNLDATRHNGNGNCFNSSQSFPDTTLKFDGNIMSLNDIFVFDIAWIAMAVVLSFKRNAELKSIEASSSALRSLATVETPLLKDLVTNVSEPDSRDATGSKRMFTPFSCGKDAG